MQFVIIAYDGENALEKRMEVRQQHIDNIEKFDEYLETEPYCVNHVWEKVLVENMNVVFLDGEKVGK